MAVYLESIEGVRERGILNGNDVKRAETLDTQRRARMQEILEQAVRERRDTTRREAAEIRELEREREELADIIATYQPGPGRTINPTDPDDPTYRATREQPPTLNREQSVADYLDGHGHRSGYTRAEARSFSFGRMVQGVVSGNWHGADIERRALAEGTLGAGGALTPELLSASVIDRIRNRARVFQAGATTVVLDSDSVAIPRLATGVTAAWRAENAPVAESDPTFERVTFTPRTLAVMIRLSWELVSDLTSAGAAIIETELVESLALELDRVALVGSGTAPEPRGIRNQAGITTIINGATGAAATYDMLLQGVSAVEAAGFEPNAAIAAPRYAKSLGLLKDTTGQPLMPPPYIANVPILTTNQVVVDETTGASTDTSAIYVGEWSQLLIGIRPTVGISVERANIGEANVSIARSDTAYIGNMQTALVAYLRADIQVAYPAAFAVVTGVRP